MKRQTLISAIIFVAAIVIGVAVVAGTMKADPAPKASQPAENSRPTSIPRPGSGTAPQRPGDRGGWEQLAIFGLTLASMAGIGVVIFRGGKKARAGKALWAEAGASGRDGALLAFDQLAPPPPDPATSSVGGPAPSQPAPS